MKRKENVRFVVDNKGNKTGVLIPYKDLATVYKARKKNSKTIPYEQVKKELFDDAAE